MLKKKTSSNEKKRKHPQSEERHDASKRRSNESHVEDSKDELADPELDRIGSDIEEGGLDLSLPFQPITAYVTNKKEMLEQCFHVLGERKLAKMLPDELKDCSLEEIRKLCWEQLEQISEKNVMHILAEVGGSGEESDVLSINADTYDSDIEGPKEEQAVKAEDVAVKVEDNSGESTNSAVNPEPGHPEPPTDSKPTEAKKDIQSDIDRSVSEILALSSTSSKEEAKDQSAPPLSAADSSPVQGGHGSSCASQPSIQQLELLELEMRARAIKALMKASDGKKSSATKNV
ncbi:hypothetical protein PAMA_013931 [Pampus argenteus]